MNETLGQLFETLSTLEPLTFSGIGLAAVSVGYFVYHVRKNKNAKNEDNDDSSSEKDKSNDVNDITMETKYFKVDDSHETTEMTTFKDLDNLSLKPNLHSFDNSDGIEISHNLNTDDATHNHINESKNDNVQESLLDNHNTAIDFIEESNKDLEKLSVDNYDTNTNSDLTIQHTDSEIVHEQDNNTSTFSVDLSDLDAPILNTEFTEDNISPIKIESSQLSHSEKTDLENLDSIENINNDNPKNPILKPQNHISLFEENEHKESNELLFFAVEADNHNNRKDAITYLQQAIQTENNLTDRVRLKIIFQTYENTDKSLKNILEEIPTIKQVQELTSKKSAPVRFVKAEDLKFADEEEKVTDSEIDEQITLEVKEFSEKETQNKDNFDVASLLAIPQTDEPEEASLTGEEINSKVLDAMNNIPSLSDVTFKNIDAADLDNKDHLEQFLETLAEDIEKDNIKVAQQSLEDNILTESILEEVKLREIQNLTQSEISPIHIEHQEITTKIDEISLSEQHQNDEKLNALTSLNFHDVSNIKKSDEQEIVTKVWVNLIINNGEQIFINKKFQINGEFGSIDGNTSLNRQINSWVKHTYNTSSYVVTLLLPVN